MKDLKLILNLSNEGPFYDYIISSLKDNDLIRDSLFYRIIKYGLVQRVLDNGTDRDKTSMVRRQDFEDIIMKEYGLDPAKDADQVMWVFSMPRLKNNLRKSGSYAINVYAGDELEIMCPGNGFCRFLNPDKKLDALVAVFKRDS